MATIDCKLFAEYLLECYEEREEEHGVWDDTLSRFATESQSTQMETENEIKAINPNAFRLMRALSRAKKRARNEDDSQVRDKKKVNLQSEFSHHTTF